MGELTAQLTTHKTVHCSQDFNYEASGNLTDFLHAIVVVIVIAIVIIIVITSITIIIIIKGDSNDNNSNCKNIIRDINII